MITILRKHHRWLMIVIAILAIPFVFYFSKTDFSARRLDDLGQVYGRAVTRIEFQKHARMFSLARDLGMFTLLQDLTAGATSENSMYSDWTFNRIILRHEAERLGIRPNNAEIVELVKTLRPFQGAQGFDPAKFDDFVKTELPPLGFNEAQIEELASDQLSLDRIKKLIGSGVQMSEGESRENFTDTYGKMQVAVVRLNAADFANDVKPSDDDVAKYYESHKTQFKTEEKRKIEWASFTLSDEQKKLQGKERTDALQKLADKANDFSQQLLDKKADFAQLAAQMQAPLHTTGEFTSAAPDPQLAGQPQLLQYAFQIRPEEPISDPIQLPDGFVVVHLLGRVEARPLTLDEAKPKVLEALKTEKTRELASQKGSQIATQLRAALAAGTPLDAAAQQAGAKVDRVPPFSQMEMPTPSPAPNASPSPTPAPPADMAMIKNVAAELKPGEVSEFTPTASGGIIAVVEKRDPIDPAAYQQGRKDFDDRYLKGKRSIAFYEWLRDRRSAAGIQSTVEPTRIG